MKVLIAAINVHFLDWVRKLPCHARVFRVDTNMSRTKKAFFYATLRPRLRLLSRKYDVVFCDWFGEIASLTSWMSSKQIFVRVHRQEVHNPIHIRAANLKNIKAIITVSNFYRTLVKEIVGDKVPVYVVPNGVDTEKFSYNPRVHSPLRMCTVSNLVPRKRIFDLIASNPDLQIDIGGTGEETRILEDAKRRFNLKARICGYVELPKFYHEHDIFIMNSSDEGHSVALTEAMSCGLIPLCFAWHGVEEILSEEHIYYDYEDMRKKISRIEKMPRKEIVRLKRKMRSTAESEFSLERQAKNFLEIFSR